MQAQGRLDAFTDAAFAFAVSLMVIGGAGAPLDYSGLVRSILSIPSFAIGFATIGMFWHAHVRWRAVRGEGDTLSTMLTFLLVFLVLIYVYPLRAMAVATASFATGSGDHFGGSLAGLFAIYGGGFMAMSAAVALLFADAMRNRALEPNRRHAARGELAIWSILAVTGLVSTVAALVPASARFAPWAYATLPLTTGVFSAFWFRKR